MIIDPRSRRPTLLRRARARALIAPSSRLEKGLKKERRRANQFRRQTIGPPGCLCAGARGRHEQLPWRARAHTGSERMPGISRRRTARLRPGERRQSSASVCRSAVARRDSSGHSLSLSPQTGFILSRSAARFSVGGCQKRGHRDGSESEPLVSQSVCAASCGRRCGRGRARRERAPGRSPAQRLTESRDRPAHLGVVQFN